MSGCPLGDSERCIGCPECYLALGVNGPAADCPKCHGTGCTNDEHRNPEDYR